MTPIAEQGASKKYGRTVDRPTMALFSGITNQYVGIELQTCEVFFVRIILSDSMSKAVQWS